MYLAILVTCSANVLDSITEMEIQSLVSNKIPNIDRSSLVIEWSFGHFCSKFLIELAITKF